MLTYLLIKPGATHLLPQLSESLTEMQSAVGNNDSGKCVKIIREGIEILRGRNTPNPKSEILYVGTGITSEGLFNRLYLTPPPNLGGDYLRKSMLNQPYGIIIIDVECPIRDALNIVKGKFLTDQPEERLGVRGIMREKYRTLGKNTLIPEERRTPSLGENFIHTPDNEEEAKELLDYITSAKNREEKIELYNSIIPSSQGGSEKLG